MRRRSFHTSFSREEALPHFDKNSEASPGPSEKLPLGKRIYDSGHEYFVTEIRILIKESKIEKTFLRGE
jgi:hypothetical protein